VVVWDLNWGRDFSMWLHNFSVILSGFIEWRFFPLPLEPLKEPCSLTPLSWWNQTIIKNIFHKMQLTYSEPSSIYSVFISWFHVSCFRLSVFRFKRIMCIRINLFPSHMNLVSTALQNEFQNFVWEFFNASKPTWTALKWKCTFYNLWLIMNCFKMQTIIHFNSICIFTSVTWLQLDPHTCSFATPILVQA